MPIKANSTPVSWVQRNICEKGNISMNIQDNSYIISSLRNRRIMISGRFLLCRVSKNESSSKIRDTLILTHLSKYCTVYYVSHSNTLYLGSLPLRPQELAIHNFAKCSLIALLLFYYLPINTTGHTGRMLLGLLFMIQLESNERKKDTHFLK